MVRVSWRRRRELRARDRAVEFVFYKGLHHVAVHVAALSRAVCAGVMVLYCDKHARACVQSVVQCRHVMLI